MNFAITNTYACRSRTWAIMATVLIFFFLSFDSEKSSQVGFILFFEATYTFSIASAKGPSNQFKDETWWPHPNLGSLPKLA